MALTDDLQAYWKLDEASGTRFDAWSVNDLADNNTVTQAVGIVNNAGQFTRANSEFLSIGDNVALSFGDEPLTIAGWVYLDSKPGGGAKPIVAKNDPGTSNREYLLYFSPGDDRFVFEVSGDGSTTTFVLANTFGSPPTGQFIFIVGTHDPVANQISISVNNGTADTASHSVGIFNGVAEFRLGAQDTGSTDFIDGRIDEVGVWRRVLTTQEITDLYNGGAGVTLEDFAPTTPFVLQTITSDTSLFGTTTQTIDSDVTLLTGIFSQLITSDSEILPPPAIQTINSDTSIQAEATQTIDSDTGVAATTTQGIASNTSINSEVSQTLQSDTNIIVNGAELKLFKESDLSTEVGTAANPIDFSSVEAGTSLQHPDNPFVLFNDKGGTLQSVDAKEIVLSVLELNLVDELVGTSAGTASQTFTVAFPPVELLDTLTVKVNNVEWTRLDTFIGAGPTDEVYTFDFTLGQVTFGDGTQGKIPPVGNTLTISYTPDTILFGKEVSEQLFLGVQSNDVIANTVTVDRERVAPLDVNTCVTLRSPITNVTGVFLNSDPNKLGTNFFTSGAFDANTGTITLGTSLPSVQDVLIDYTYQIEDDIESGFTQIGRLTKSATLNPIPSNNGKKLNFIIIVPFSASPSSPQKIRFKLRVEFKQ